jgi:hypothetical protein
VTRARRGPACVDVAFGRRYAVDPHGEVALEDYARALTRAEGAEAVPAPDGGVGGLHLCAPAEPLRPAVIEDIEAFAGEISQRRGDGLGWS